MPEFLFATQKPRVVWRFQLTAENLNDTAQFIFDNTGVNAQVVNNGVEWQYGVLPVVSRRAEIGDWLWCDGPTTNMGITYINISQTEPVESVGLQPITTNDPAYTITE